MFADDAKGFRPFFLLAAAFAAVVAPSWMVVWTGGWVPRGPLHGVAWHGHEMLFGFTLAVVAGFLLTAVSNWTGRPTLTGRPLWALAATWLAARVSLWLVPGWWGAALDLLFLPGLAWGIGRPLLATGDRRNYPFLGLLGALWVMNLAMYLDAAGVWPGAGPRAGRAALALVVVIVLVVTGRVVPMFTRNATGAAGIGNSPLADAVAIGAAVSLVPLELAGWTAASGTVAGLAGVAAFARMRAWGTRHALDQPLLWVLHAGHASVALGLVLAAVRIAVPLPPSTHVHAVTVGGIGLLTIGMMARVSLGHTGRPLQVGRLVSAAFTAVALAALVRVAGPFLAPDVPMQILWLAALTWSAGFALFAVAYLPILSTPRVDGKPG